jgi:hypothetical protein
MLYDYYRMFLLSFPCARLLCRTGSLHRLVYPVTATLLKGTMQETVFIDINSCFYAIGQSEHTGFVTPYTFRYRFLIIPYT